MLDALLAMDEIDDIYWRQLQSRLGGIAFQLTRVRFAPFRAKECWAPAINAYRCQEGIILCVDLAGVEKADIRLQVEPRKVLITGRRRVLEPESSRPSLQVLALEIDHGPFERQVTLPLAVDPEKIEAEQRNGVLWVFLPAYEPGSTNPTRS